MEIGGWMDGEARLGLQGVVGDGLEDLEGFVYSPGKDTRRNRVCKTIASRLGMMRRMVTGDGNGGGENIRGQGET
jgi:hypothetical protein